MNASLLVTELFPALKEHKIDFLKVRGAIGQTGNDAGVYRTSTWYRIANFGTTGTGNNYYTTLPFGGVLGMTSSNTIPGTDLKPEMTTEYELGLLGNFFDNQLSIDCI